MCCVYSLFLEVRVTALTLFKFPQRRWPARSRVDASSLRQPMCGSDDVGLRQFGGQELKFWNIAGVL